MSAPYRTPLPLPEGASPEKRRDAPVPDLTGTSVGRFTIQARLGRGGMGEVYRAYDTKLRRLVALKRIVSSPDHEYRERLWSEAQFASRLNDPRIAAIYDVFEDKDKLFLVMEYVEGQTLRERLAKPISISDFLIIAIECAEALTAAHKGGVLHHDIKPENIMLTTNAQVKMLDFGVARRLPTASMLSTEVDSHAGDKRLSGTLAYMAPEVLEEGTPTERSDIFSLGIIFYEVLAGRHPFLTKGFLSTCNRILKETQAPLRGYNPRVPAEFERIINKMLAKKPAERYVSAADVLVDLRALRKTHTADSFTIPATAPPPATRKKSRVSFAVAAVVVACLALLGTYLYRGFAARVFAAHDWMLVADFDNHSGEPLFDETVGESLAHALQQSRYVNVVPRTQAVAAAKLAGRNDLALIDAALGREICQREAYRALLTGDVQKAGAGYEIYVKVLDPKQGSTVFADKQSLRSPSELYSAMDELAKRLRNHLGESMAQIEQRSVPLARVTTPSLEALKRYSAALKKYSAGDVDDFFPLANSAVALDPDFAMAHLYLARAYYQLGRSKDFREQLTFARKGIDHVSERERFLIVALDYSADSLEEKSLEQYRLLTELYPDDVEGLQGFAEESTLVGRWQDAIGAEKHILQINPHSELDYNRLIIWLDDTNQFSAALQTYSSARSSGATAPELLWGAGLAYLGQDDPDKAREQFQLLAQQGGDYEKGLAALTSARVLIYQGRLREAAESLRAGLLLAEKQHSAAWVPVYRYLLSGVLLMRGQLADAKAESRRLASGQPQPETESEERRRAGLLALDAGEIPTAQAELVSLAKLNDTQDSGYIHSCYYNLKGAVELAQQKPDSGEESQRRATVYFPLPEGYARLADTLAAQHKWTESAQAREHFLEFKGITIDQYAPADWVVGHLRLARALVQAGESQGALKQYDTFLHLWANADADLPMLREAREERARIPQTNGSNASASSIH